MSLRALVFVVCLATPVTVQAQGDYLDVFVVKVKPEKHADFLVIAKNNVKNSGILLFESVYGEANVFQRRTKQKGRTREVSTVKI